MIGLSNFFFFFFFFFINNFITIIKLYTKNQILIRYVLDTYWKHICKVKKQIAVLSLVNSWDKVI